MAETAGLPSQRFGTVDVSLHTFEGATPYRYARETRYRLTPHSRAYASCSVCGWRDSGSLAFVRRAAKEHRYPGREGSH